MCVVQTLLRYVDDTFVLWPHGADQLEEFHAHVNNQHPQIQFMKEVEKNDKINFLNVLVKKKNDRFSTVVYRKSTHMGRYTDFTSHHHRRSSPERLDVCPRGRGRYARVKTRRRN